MNKNKTILALIPGRGWIGYAVIHQQVLIYYGITSLSRFKTIESIGDAIERFLSKIINRFSINRIAIRRLNQSQKLSILLVEITNQLKTISKNRKIEVSWYKGKFINQQFCEINERPTKAKTTLFLISKYPELKRYHNLKQIWQQRYYTYIFQAIALGLVCLEELNNKQNREENSENKSK